MAWSDIVAFIVEREPEFEANSQGVPEEDIASLEEGLKVRLPSIYRDFLRSCGVAASGWAPFGPCWEHDFYELVEELPSEDYPAQEVFPVAHDADESRISPPDLFVDLRDEPEDDAPLIEFDTSEAYAPAALASRGFTLAEQFTAQVFRAFEASNYAHGRRVVVHCADADARTSALDQVCEVLTHKGFERAMPGTDGISTWMVEGGAALVAGRRTSPIVRVELYSCEDNASGLLAEQLLEHVDGAKLARPSRAIDD